MENNHNSELKSSVESVSITYLFVDWFTDSWSELKCADK